MKDLSVDLKRAIIWQYEKSEKLKALVEAQNNAHHELVQGFWERWERDVFNIDTANAFGLSIWARILDVNLSVQFAPQPDKVAFGVGPNRRNFAPPSGFGSREGGSVELTTEQARMVIRARYFSLTERPTLTNINEFLRRYFWRGDSKVYVTDPLDMSFVLYTFSYTPDGELAFLIDNMDFLPRPSTVGSSYRIVGKMSWGVGPNRRNFAPPSNFGVLQ